MFFRALSFVITGEEDQQSALPKYVCDFMELQRKEIGEKNPKDYLEDSKMRKDGTWGTTDENLSAAALLKITIYTWNSFGERLCWNRHGHNKEISTISGYMLIILVASIMILF